MVSIKVPVMDTKACFAGTSVLAAAAANRSFGINLQLLHEAREAALSLGRGTVGQNVMYFETGQGSALSARANHGLDSSKLTPWSKFYLPHKESIKKHIKREKHPLDIDAVLARLPKEPKVMAPSIDDLKFSYPITYVATGSSTVDKCRAEINQMGAGDRSNRAVRVAGTMGKANFSPELKQQLYELMVLRGVDPSTLKQVRKYAKMI